MFSIPLTFTFMRQALKIRLPHNFAILRETFALKNEVITASMPKIIVNAAITVQQYRFERKSVIMRSLIKTKLSSASLKNLFTLTRRLEIFFLDSRFRGNPEKNF